MKTIKQVVSILFMMIGIASSAQDIILSLPHYKQGQYECDTIFKHYGGAGGNGKGTIAFSGDLTTSLLTGVKFYFQVDSIEPGGAPFPSALIDSLGIKVPMRKGARYEIPVKIEVRGKIRYYLTIEGTPVSGNELYYCNLWMKVPLIEDEVTQDIRIQNGTGTQCIVDPLQFINAAAEEVQVHVYPNPATDKINVSVNRQWPLLEYAILDLSGKVVLNGLLNNSVTTLALSALPAGNYLMQIGNGKRQVFKIVKK